MKMLKRSKTIEIRLYFARKEIKEKHGNDLHKASGHGKEHSVGTRNWPRNPLRKKELKMSTNDKLPFEVTSETKAQAKMFGNGVRGEAQKHLENALRIARKQARCLSEIIAELESGDEARVAKTAGWHGTTGAPSNTIPGETAAMCAALAKWKVLMELAGWMDRQAE